jgi:hypothetical protein
MYVPLTKTFSPERYAGALSGWTWLDFEGRVPVFASCFGDIVFCSADGYWFLDIATGTFQLTWSDHDAMTSDLRTTIGQDRYLLAGLAVAAYNNGVELADNEVYAFDLPRVLGGRFEIDNVAALDFEVSVSLAGQIHRQVREVTRGRPARRARWPGVARPPVDD